MTKLIYLFLIFGPCWIYETYDLIRDLIKYQLKKNIIKKRNKQSNFIIKVLFINFLDVIPKPIILLYWIILPLNTILVFILLFFLLTDGRNDTVFNLTEYVFKTEFVLYIIQLFVFGRGGIRGRNFKHIKKIYRK